MATSSDRVWLMIPTTTNLLLRVQAEVTAGRRDGSPRLITIPSLVRRARMCVEETGVIPVIKRSF